MTIAGRLVAVAVLALAGVLEAGPAADEAELTRLLREFLAGASRNDAAAHERFWAEDLIYTGSSGKRIGKADILADVRAPQGPPPAGSATTYTAEDIRIQQYGDTAIVAFRLVGTTGSGGRTQVTRYLNTGTFLRRKGIWQAVSWQATKAPRSEEEARSEVAAAQAAIDQSLLAADVKALEPLLDASFVWIHPTGERAARRDVLEALGAGTLLFPRRGTGSVTVSVYGDTAIAYTSSDTTTFVNKDGVWKAVARHTSRVP